MNGETTRTYGERLAEQMAYLDRLVQETSGHQRGIGCYVARHNRRHPDRPVSHNKDVRIIARSIYARCEASYADTNIPATYSDTAALVLRTPFRCMLLCPS